MTNKLTFLIVLLSAGLSACGSNQVGPETETVEQEKSATPAHHQHTEEPKTEPASEPATAASDVLPNDGTRAVGDVTTCPVTDDVFKISENAPTAVVDGKTYFFCCKGCIKEFNADPAKFLSATKEPAKHDHGTHEH